MKTDLYRHFNTDGDLLYVGVSLNAAARLIGHRYRSKWFDEMATITIEKFPTRHGAQAAEIAAIRSERPKYNQAYAAPKRVTTLRPYLNRNGLMGRPRKYRRPDDDQRAKLLVWWNGPLHTDDVEELAGELLGRKVPRVTLAAWLGKREPHPGRRRKASRKKRKS